MIGLNNKGMTIVEILVCFMIVTFISVSLFNTVETFNNKKSIESAKSALLEYRNNIDKMIEDDLIHKGLINAQVFDHHNDTPNATHPDGNFFYQDVKLFFRDGSTKTLRIYDERAGDYYYNLEGQAVAAGEKEAACTGHNDKFYIQYGSNLSPSGDYIEYLLPDVGEYENAECSSHEIIKDIRFGKIEVSVKDNVLVIYVGFTHPELGNDYSINIVAPINYSA